MVLLQHGSYTLIHIPLKLYSAFVQPILQVLVPQSQDLASPGHAPERELRGLSLDSHQHGFLNISMTPIEASVVCDSAWARRVFEPIVASLPREAARSVELSKNEYMVLSIISAGLDAASRVLELTSPLALAGISIFFISTYYSDFILVPAKERHNVVKALQARGFELSGDSTQFVSPAAVAAAQGRAAPMSPPAAAAASADGVSPPRTPPPSTLAELQTRAFDLLKKRSVAPYVDDDLELVQCSGREVSPPTDHLYDSRGSSRRHGSGRHPAAPSWVDHIDTRLYTCIVAAIISQPRFLSITLAQDDPPSLLLDKNILPVFGDTIVGDTEARHIPIFLDLVSLPLEVTGIVCGVAGKLVQDMQMAESSELSYLSTARAGAVILPDRQSKRALEILEPLLSKTA